MHLAVTIVLTVMFLFFSSVLISWVLVSRIVYTTEILKPGEAYISNGREYVFPNLEVHGECFKLKDEVVKSLRSILTKVGRFLDNEQVKWWVTGGTLLGSVRHASIPMPFDDDCDIAVSLTNRDKVFSSDFADRALNNGIDLFTLFGNNKKSADRHGSVVRAQHNGGNAYESLDIFFWETKTNGKVVKLDGWNKNGQNVESVSEIFNFDDVFPIKRKVIDGLDICTVNKPRNVIEQQYSSNVWKSILPRPLLISHSFPLRFLNLLFIRGSTRRKLGYKQNV